MRLTGTSLSVALSSRRRAIHIWAVTNTVRKSRNASKDSGARCARRRCSTGVLSIVVAGLYVTPLEFLPISPWFPTTVLYTVGPAPVNRGGRVGWSQDGESNCNGVDVAMMRQGDCSNAEEGEGAYEVHDEHSRTEHSLARSESDSDVVIRLYTLRSLRAYAGRLR